MTEQKSYTRISEYHPGKNDGTYHAAGTINAIILSLLVMASPAYAYIGPGAGISVVGSLLGILGTVLLAVGAILLWPLRRMLKKRSGTEDPELEETSENTDQADENTATARVSDK